MELLEATKLAFVKYANFHGTSTRPDFWYFFLTLVIATTALGVFSEELATLASIVSIVPLAAVSARRLREANLAMGNFFWLLLPVIGWAIFLIRMAKPASKPNYPNY